MDTDRCIEVVPHYAVMLLLVYLALATVELIVGERGFWAELLIIAVVVITYRPVVMRLGIGHGGWEQQ